MQAKRQRFGSVGRLVGLVLVVVAIASVVLLRIGGQPPEQAPPVRPVKTIIVGSDETASRRTYPGTVRADQEVNLAFQVAGRIVELPVKKGESVQKGQLLAKLDQRDFQSKLESAKAVNERNRLNYEKFQKAFEKQVATRKELDDARTTYEKSQADVKLAQKALDDTVLTAPFGGVVATTFVKNFQDVQAKQPILSLQDISKLEIHISLSERRVAAFREDEKSRYAFSATFDFAPGRSFPLTVEEFTTQADPTTQTYTAIFNMDPPKNLTILPGMTATVIEKDTAVGADDGRFYIPLDAAAIDPTGQYYVWVLSESGEGTFTVSRQNIQVGPMSGNVIEVTDGLKAGQRIATAGVNFLHEGQEVRLFVPKAEGGVL